jgi:hypothetical protein
MAEKGILPEDDYKLIRKLESYFGISLIKKDFEKVLKKEKNLELDKVSLSNIKISDLKKLKEEQVEETDFEEIDFEDEEDSEDSFEEDEEETFESKHIIKENKYSCELSQKDIDNLLFRS